MEEYYSLLSASDLFYGLTSEELGSMLHCLGAKIVDTQKGDPVFLEGDPAGFVGIVLEGSVQVVQEDYFGSRSVIRLVKNLLTLVSRKNLMLNEKIRFMSQRTTREKLLAYLSDQAKKTGSAEFTIPYDRQALADYLSVERSPMSAEISKLKGEGLLDTHRSTFKIMRQTP